MNENRTTCPNCGRHDEISDDHFHRLVASNREAAMQALGVRKEESAMRQRFRMTPFVDTGEDGKPRVGLRRAL